MNHIIPKLFFTHSYFTIAIRRQASKGVINDSVFEPDYVLPATARKWAADPILAEDGRRTWLFYEAVENNHGHIEVAEVMPDCTLGKPTVLLKDNCHYSYPFVFRWKGIWYMIPESSGAKEVRLYQAESFPLKWNLRECLLRECAVDTTVYERNGGLFLLTFLTDNQSERVTPKAYELELSDTSAKLLPLLWGPFDELKTRGAGPAFFENGNLYRPIQINKEQRYGDAIGFCKMQDSDLFHSEIPGGILRTPVGKQFGIYIDGAHTYCRTSQYEAVDLRCRDFDFWKIPRRLIQRIRK